MIGATYFWARASRAVIDFGARACAVQDAEAHGALCSSRAPVPDSPMASVTTPGDDHDGRPGELDGLVVGTRIRMRVGTSDPTPGPPARPMPRPPRSCELALSTSFVDITNTRSRRLADRACQPPGRADSMGLQICMPAGTTPLCQSCSNVDCGLHSDAHVSAAARVAGPLRVAPCPTSQASGQPWRIGRARRSLWRCSVRPPRHRDAAQAPKPSPRRRARRASGQFLDAQHHEADVIDFQGRATIGSSS